MGPVPIRCLVFKGDHGMSRVSVFSAPFLLGFESFEERVDRLAKSADGYPPYNIERMVDADGTERFLVSVAVAGFSASELDVLVEDNQILVRGKQKDDGGKEYLHRGIAARQFQRSFLLAEGMIVKDATLGHGMLVVSIERPQVAKIARRIEIRSV
jgi:HSP20 family molecular chaperone IbpA